MEPHPQYLCAKLAVVLHIYALSYIELHYRLCCYLNMTSCEILILDSASVQAEMGSSVGTMSFLPARHHAAEW